jgi:TonB family protein
MAFRSPSHPRPVCRRPIFVGLAGLFLAGATLGGANDPSAPPAPEATLLERAFVLDAGTAVPRDAAAAAALYQAAADAGDPYAHLRLGYLAETGDGVPQNYAVARLHYQAAADAGLKEGHLHVAICHLEGWGGPVDRAAFAREIQTAAEAGDVPAQRILATMLAVGFVVAEDKESSLRWLERAAATGDTDAELGAGLARESALRFVARPDYSLARDWYQFSAEREVTAGMRAMARTFFAAPRASRNWELARQWLQLATDSGDGEAPYILAVCEVLHVDVVNRDETQALAWLHLAAERGNYRAAEVVQLTEGGQPLADAMRYVLTVPQEERYIKVAQRWDAAANPPDGGTHRPLPIRVVEPIYPGALRMTGLTGQVRVEFAVDTKGRVLNEHVLESPHPLFSASALAAVRQWRFQPAMKDGRLIGTARVQLPVKFLLQAEQLDGVDALLRYARRRVGELGPEVQADGDDLRMAAPVVPVGVPRQEDGSAFPHGSRALILLVLDDTGRPLRGHILRAEPAAMGPAMLAVALAGRFQPRVVEGRRIPSHAVLPYAVRTADDQIFRSLSERPRADGGANAGNAAVSNR